MTKLATAIRIAAEVHENQVDKGGVPYILHPLAVMQKVADSYTDDFRREELLCVAVLHDAVEDVKGPKMNREFLKDKILDSFGEDVYAAIMALTKSRDFYEDYDHYVERVAENWMARLVKIADLSHNLDATRLPSGRIAEKDFERWDKYHRALVRLSRED